MDFLGRDEREAGIEIETHLVPKYRQGSGPRAVGPLGTIVANMSHQIEILLHRVSGLGSGLRIASNLVRNTSRGYPRHPVKSRANGDNPA